MVGILIIAATLAASGAITALVMGAGWLTALLIYSLGGAALALAMAMLVSLRKDASAPTLATPPSTDAKASMADAQISRKPHVETV